MSVDRNAVVIEEANCLGTEADLWVPGGVEEILALDHVGTKLLRPPDRDRLDLGHACESMTAIGQLFEPSLHLLERGAERANAHVAQLCFERGVLRVGGERTAEGLSAGGHGVAPILVVDTAVSTASVSARRAA
jgi:hypothetical protein